MKSVVRMMSIAVVFALALGACKKDKVDYVDNVGTDTENIGYLSFSSFEATVMEDTENIANPAAATRASVDINTFDVVITNQAGSVVGEYKYGELPSEPISLEAGVYKVAMSSGQMSGAAWESPVYAAEKEFTVVRKQTTVVNDIVCKLANIKVTVAYSADIAESLDPAYTTMTVALKDNNLLYAMNEERAGYFKPLEVTNTLELTLSCRYKGQDKDIIMTNSIANVKAAQWRKINVVIQHASDGTATIGIVCDTWTYDETIVFDTSAFLMEEVIPDDTDMPEIVWEGHDLSQPFELTDDMFDGDGNFTSNINLDITSKSAIASIDVKVSSDNADFTKAYSELMPLDVDICDGSVSNAILKMMGYPTDAKGATSTRIKLASQVEMLTSYEGTHSYEITVTDVNGRASTVTLAVKYGQNVAPTIVWVGYDINKQQTYFSGMTCDLKVTAPLTIADFKVKIISDTLTPEELAGVGLAGEFSLINDTQFFESLKNLGFPTGDEVKGKTEVNLSISNFLGVLAMLGSGDHNFEMSVTDAEGNVTTKTVMLHFE